MTRARTTIAALALCVASLCVFGAASASAAGVTAHTCVDVGSGGSFSDAQCETPQANGKYQTVPIAEGTTTEVETDAIGLTIWHFKAGLSNITFTCAKAHGTGHLTNTKVGAVHNVHGTKIVKKYSECEAHLETKSGTEEACEVESISGTAGQKGVVETNALTSTNTGTEHDVSFLPEGGGSSYMEFNILSEKKTGLSCALPKTKVTMTGTTTATGNTAKQTHITFSGAKDELKVNGNAGAKYTSTTITYMKGEPTKTISLETIP